MVGLGGAKPEGDEPTWGLATLVDNGTTDTSGDQPRSR